VAAAQRATELAPDELWFLRGAATLFLATGLQMDGHAAEALDILTQALERSPEAPTTYWTRLLLGMALVHWSTAELDRTLSVCDRLAALSQRDGLPASLAWANFLSGAARYLRGDPAAAARDFSVIVESPVSTNPHVSLQAHLGLAAAHLAAGRQAEAAEAARRTTAWALEVGMPGAINLTESFQARLALATGRAGAAIAWAANRLPPRSSAPLFLMEEPLLTWVHVQLARPGGAGLDEAADALAVERRFAEETHNTLRRIHVLALEALVLEASSRRVQALDALQGALALAEPGGIVQPFLDLLPGMAPLLQALAARSDGNAHVWRVQARRAGSRTPAPTGSASHGAGDGTLLDPLTPREMEILALLAQRLTNGEIAARLVVSPVTVKTHAHSIYSKLSARNRREAVARAQALGLLADS
jgi:LuxR family maltose regulon positive regulatory protein